MKRLRHEKWLIKPTLEYASSKFGLFLGIVTGHFKECSETRGKIFQYTLQLWRHDFYFWSAETPPTEGTQSAKLTFSTFVVKITLMCWLTVRRGQKTCMTVNIFLFTVQPYNKTDSHRFQCYKYGLLEHSISQLTLSKSVSKFSSRKSEICHPRQLRHGHCIGICWHDSHASADEACSGVWGGKQSVVPPADELRHPLSTGPWSPSAVEHFLRFTLSRYEV